jgi:hypothetical protein
MLPTNHYYILLLPRIHHVAASSNKMQPARRIFYIGALSTVLHCIVWLIACGLLAMMWEENYGDDSSSKHSNGKMKFKV